MRIAASQERSAHMQSPEDQSIKLSSFQFHKQAVQAPVGNRMVALDAIELRGEILAVLTWLGHTERGLRKPEFVLPLSAVKHQDLRSDPTAPCKWGVNAPLPLSLFDGSASRQVRRQSGVRRGPDLTLPLAPVRH